MNKKRQFSLVTGIVVCVTLFDEGCLFDVQWEKGKLETFITKMAPVCVLGQAKVQVKHTKPTFNASHTQRYTQTASHEQASNCSLSG